MDNSQVPGSLQANQEVAAVALAPLARDRQGRTEGLIRIGLAAWRVARGPQRMLIRRTTAATSSSGIPTGQTADAAALEPRAEPHIRGRKVRLSELR